MILLRFTTVFNVGTWPTVVNRRQSQPPQLFVALEMWPLAQRFVALEMWPVRDWPNDVGGLGQQFVVLSLCVWIFLLKIFRILGNFLPVTS